MQRIAVYGAGGFGREVMMLIEHINAVHNDMFEIAGFFDDSISRGVVINDYPVLGGINELNAWNEPLCIALAFGEPVVKKNIRAKIVNKLISYPTLIHPSVIKGKENLVKIGDGCIICAGSILTVNIVIQDFVILNLGCTVGHDVTIGSYSSFMPSVNISGEVVIGEGVYGGTGTKIVNQLQVGEWTKIGAGAVVAKSLPAHCTAVGVPARPIKFHEEAR